MRKLFKKFWARKKLRWITLIGVFFLVASVVGVEMSSQSWFCNSCHIMNSYYDSWKVSAHKDVDCVQCHIAPGMESFLWAKLNGAGQVVDDMLHRTSTKPSAAVSDLSCTRAGCHAMTEVKAIERREQPYFFEHSKHVGLEYKGVEIHCSNCHSHVKGDQHFEVNTNVCITCHLLKPSPTTGEILLAADGKPAQVAMEAGNVKVAPNTCKSCHNPPAGPIEYHGLQVVHEEYLAYGAACESCHRNVTEQPKPITDDKCIQCHDFGREKITNLEDLHRQHNVGEHKVECFSCHGLLSHGPKAMAMKLEQIDCRACHTDQHQLQQAAYKARPETMPHGQPADASAVTPMFMAHVDCTGCHIKPRPVSTKPGSGATVAAASPQACDTCHKAGLGEQMIPLWQKQTRALYDKAMGMLPATPPADGSKEPEHVAEARRLLEMVRLDGSWGVHNPKYTEGLLRQTIRLLGGTPDTQPEVTQPEVTP